jgi:hypothetical protein
MKPTQTKPSIVFCHGLWADGSCFSKVITALQASQVARWEAGTEIALLLSE